MTTTHSVSPKSDSARVVVHYHINNHYHLHDHMVYYAENYWLHDKEEDKCPIFTAGLPAVVPGSRPKSDNSTNAFMNFVHPENHPADSQVHMMNVYGHTSRDHKQQLYRNGDVRSESGQNNAKFRVFLYTPTPSTPSTNHVHYNQLYLVHHHNHTVLLRGASPPGVIQLNAESQVDDLGEVTKDLDLYLLTGEIFTSDLETEG